MTTPMDLTGLLTAYRSGATRPSEVVEGIFARIDACASRPIWIALCNREETLARARKLESSADKTLPLFGISFAVKDNIDVAGMDTTAGCPGYAYRPDSTAPVVQRLLDAGAILIGKTNLDQFATGLVGTRSPYGACASAFDDRYISGGSSSGSALAVARALVTFALGTDTAGSGRVPAAFNNIVGLKPTRGLLSTAGVVPACRSLDCVSIFALTCSDAHEVLQVAQCANKHKPGQGSAPWMGAAFRFGCPAKNQLEFFGDEEAERLFEESLQTLEKLGGTRVEIDFRPFRETAELLYSGPWVAERYAAVGEFHEGNGEGADSVVKGIITKAAGMTAVQTFKAMYRLEDLREQTLHEWDRMDFLVLPTTGTTYSLEQIRQEPVRLNSNLGFYTNFVNLLDLAAVAVPAGFRDDGLPFGISLIGHAHTDAALLAAGDQLHRLLVEQLGATQFALNGTQRIGAYASGCISVAVVGAHLSGQPLNWQLTDRGARLQRSCRTARGYRLFALEGTKPPKPGLVREDGFEGPGIEVEIWSVPEDQFGSFVRDVPPPLGIGNAKLEDGTVVKCFICEPYAISDAD